MQGSQNDQARLVAIVSHFYWLGWIIAFILHSGNRTALGAFYLRQSLGFSLTYTILVMFFNVRILGWLLIVGLTIFWIMSFLNAINEEQKPVAVIGEFFQKLFKGIN